MDPLTLFYDIYELIIQHFNYGDIFRLYKVSKTWYELILHDSKFAMKKIRLSIKEKNHDEVHHMFMMQNKSSEINSDLLDLMSSKRKYQNVKIIVDHGEDLIDQLVRNLSKSLVDVQVSSDVYAEDLKIPSMRYLKLDNPIIDGLTSCSNKLWKLTASVSGKEYWQKRESPVAIKNALKNNHELESLEIDDVLTESIFSDESACDIKMKLKMFSLKCLKSFDELTHSNIRSFLATQAQLEELHIEFPDAFTLQWAYENLKYLTSLKTKVHFETNPREFDLAISNLKQLDIDLTANWQYTMNIKYALRTFIKSSPNLEVLVIRMPARLDLDDFRFLLFSAIKLKKFIQNVDDCLTTYREIFSQMSQDHENISESIEFSNMVG